MSLAGTSFTQSQARALEAGLLQRRAAGRGRRQPRRQRATRSSSRPPLIGGLAGRPRHRAVGGRHDAERRGRRLLDPQQVREPRGAGRERRRLPLRRVLDAAGHDRRRRGPPRTAATRRFTGIGGARYAYGEGTSFAAPIVVGARRARLAGRAAARLRAGGARCSRGRPPAAAGTSSPAPAWPTACAPWRSRASTTCSRPRARARVHRHGNRVRVRRERARATAPARGHELAGHVQLRAARLARRRQQLQRPREPPAPAVHARTCGSAAAAPTCS